MSKIFCVGCNEDIEPRVTTGEEIYPHRKDLYDKKILICDVCKNYKSFNGKDLPTLIPTPELRKIRMEIHDILDPLWKLGKIKRGKAYAYISNRMGYTYHNESLKNLVEGKKAKSIVTKLASELEGKKGEQNEK